MDIEDARKIKMVRSEKIGWNMEKEKRSWRVVICSFHSIYALAGNWGRNGRFGSINITRAKEGSKWAAVDWKVGN